jgi:hypothetical protein
LNFYDEQGKLEGKIIEITDGYKVKYSGSIVGVYETKKQALDAYNKTKLFNLQLKKMMNDRREAQSLVLKVFSVGIIIGLIVIATVVILSCMSFEPVINELFIN